MSPRFLVLVFKEKLLYICFTVFSNIQETQLHGSSVLLPFEAAGANGQEGESIRYWKEMKKKKGIMYGSLLLYKDSCSATGPTNTKDSAQLWSTTYIGLRVAP